MRRRRACFPAFALTLLAGLTGGCSLFKAGVPDTGPVRELVVVFTGDTEGEVAPCG